MNLEFSAPGSADEPAPVNDTPVIPGFTLTRLIGIGGMGAVYEAEQDHPRRRVAIKLAKPGLFSDEALARLSSEAEILARLEHPGIARIYAAGTIHSGARAQPYLVMELIQGKPVTLYAGEAKLSIEGRLQLFQKVAQAVQFAHQQGVIHRDLKPSNILIDTHGEPHILDFGIARVAGSTSPNPALDASDTSGTIAYMSPEQAAGNAAGIDSRTDIYALGVVMFELLSGERPHSISGLDKAAALELIRTTEPLRLAAIRRDLSGDLDCIAARAMHKDRDQRYASAAALAEDIERYLVCLPVIAHPPSTFYSLHKFARRNKVLVSASAAVLLALTGGFISSSIGWSRANKAEQAAKKSLRRALDTVDQFTTYVTTGPLDRIPGAAPVQERLLEDAVVLYEALLLDNKDNPEAKQALALALANRARFEASEGELDTSRNTLEMRVAFLRELLATPEGNTTENRYALARSLFILTRVLDRSGKLDEAGKTIQESYDIHRALLDASPQSKGYRMDVAYLLGHWARMLGGEQENSRYEEALRMWKELASDYPDDSQISRAREWTEQRLAELASGAAPARASAGTKEPRAPEIISSDDLDALRASAGRQIVVRGRVQEIAMNRGQGGLTFVNFGRGRNAFCAVIHRNAMPKFVERFGESLENLRGLDVDLNGIVDVYRDVPQLILNQPAQVKTYEYIKPANIPEISALDLPALRAQAGRDVMIKGRVYDVGFVKTHQLTYLDFEDVAGEKAAAIIRPNILPDVIKAFGGHPSVTLKGKTVRITGSIVLFKKNPNLEVESPSKIEIIQP